MRQKLINGTSPFVILIMLVTLAGIFQEDANASEPSEAKATFAGGCFWCMEESFEPLEGVIAVVSGYMGGNVETPTYEQVSAGGTGHTESIEVVYNPSSITYEELLEVFWRNVDPTTPNAQFCDHGNQYRTAIFYHDEIQKQLIDESLKKIEITKNFPEAIVTEISPASMFYPAEDYHQNFYIKNPIRYKYYKWNCGRTKRLEQLWGPS